MTVLQIQMLLHYYAIGAPYAANDIEHRNSPAVQQQRDQLLQWQMIVSDNQSPSGFKILPRGLCFIDHLKRLPLPQETTSWKMP